MNSKAALISVFAFFIFSQNSIAANEAVVRKHDGSTGHYKLLPVHSDPSHAKVVEARPEFTRANVPEKYQIPQSMLPPVRDQETRGTCVYFATVGIVETYNISKGDTTRLSEQCLVGLRDWEADEASYTGDDKPVGYRPDPDGDNLDLVAKTVSYYGVQEAKKYSDRDCRYNGAKDSKPTSLDEYNSLFTANETQAFGKGHAVEIDRAPTIERLKELISQNIPVEIATLVYMEHMYTDSWSFGAGTAASGLAGGHAIILTGYKSSKNRTWFTFKNSWGSQWGSSGYGLIDDRLLKKSWGEDPSYDMVVSYHD